jgi:hypothetical protein
VVESANFRDRDDRTEIGALDGPRLGWIFPEREMSPASVVIVRVAADDPQQLALIERDYVIQTLAA